MKQFNFGKNWLDFSQKALTAESVQQAQEDFTKLFQGIALQDKTFLDIGFGQGLSVLIAQQHGAQVVGCDINPTCQQALVQSSAYFPDIQLTEIPIFEGSILESTLVEKLLAQNHQQGFDIVHSWGVLHHTGDMQRAIEHAAALVKPEGILVIAIYNRHWSSPIWLAIKWLYSHAPNFLQKVLIYLFYPVIWLAKYLVTGQNPSTMTRGMDFFYNVVDWVGGYPYEYASIEEIKSLMVSLDFKTLKIIPAQVPTGCNEFVFIKKDEK